MRYGPRQPVIDTCTREQAETLARDAGRNGAIRVPDAALFPGGLDPSDSCVVAVLDAYLAGQLERRQS